MDESSPPAVLVAGEGDVIPTAQHRLSYQAQAAPRAQQGLERKEGWWLGSTTQLKAGEAKGGEEQPAGTTVYGWQKPLT